MRLKDFIFFGKEEIQNKHSKKSKLKDFKYKTYLIANLNVQSLKNKLDIFSDYVNDRGVDVCCISEHWASNETLQRMNVDNYVLGDSYSRQSSNHGGVAVLVRRQIKHIYIEDVKMLSIEGNIEVSAIKLINDDMIVVAVYRPPSGNADIFFSQMSQCLDVITRGPFQKICVAGDFNINFFKNDKLTRELVQLFQSYGLFHVFDEVSRINKMSITCIDNIFTNVSTSNYNKKSYDPHISDHFVQELEVMLEDRSESKKRYISKFIVNEGNIVDFEDELMKVHWESLKADNAEDTFEGFHNAVQRCFLSSFPRKSISVDHCRRRNIENKYCSVDILKKAVDAAETIYYVQKDEPSGRLLNAMKRCLREAYKEAKREHNSSYIRNADNKSAAVWKIINQETGKAKLNVADESRCTAEMLNSFFSSIGETLKNQCKTSGEQSMKMMRQFRGHVTASPNSMFMLPVTIQELNDVVRKMKSKRTPDIFGMSTTLLKRVFPIFSDFMCIVMNQCLEDGIFPNKLKMAKVLPIYKKGSIDECSNYRPISILPVFSKILEEILKRRLIRYLDRMLVLNSSQHGFRSGGSTITALVDMMEGIVEALDRGNIVEVAACDLSKAFDCVVGEILIRKMEYYGIRGKPLSIFESYLLNRVQAVYWRGETSQEKTNILGVPQGSILGPLLFILYMNDLPLNVSCSRSCLYADDTTFINDASVMSELREKSIASINHAEKWFCVNGLKLNKDKTQKLILGLVSTESHTVKILGLTVDDRLTWNEYLDSLASRLATAIYTMRRMKDIASVNTCKMVYYANFHSIATYGILLWGHSPGTKRILLKQKEAIRVISGASRVTSCRELFKKNKILTITSVFILTALLHVYDNKSRYNSNCDFHGYDTRNREALTVERHRMKRTQIGTNHIGIKLFNKLPYNLKNLPRTQLKSKIKNLLLCHTIYDIEEFLMLKL